MELILAMFCLLGGFALLVFGVVIFVIVRRSQPYTAPEIAQANAAADAHFAATVPALLPWNASALADLACQWQNPKGAPLFRRGIGQVTSIRQPDHTGWLAFYLDTKGNRGFVRLHASDRKVQLQIEQGNIRVTVDGSPLGWLRESDGTIFDSNARAVGCYHRYRGMQWWMSSQPLTPRYGAVELYGRAIAEVNDALIWGNAPFKTDAAQRPLIRLSVAALTAEEENWLLALVALELYYDALRSRASVAPIR